MTDRCNGSEELLSGLVDNELEPTQRRHTASHVLTCEGCSSATGRMLATKRLLDRSELSARVPPGFSDRWHARLGIEDAPARGRLPRLPRTAARVLAIAAVGLLLIGGALTVSSYYTPRSSSVDLLVSAHRAVFPGPLYPSGAYCPAGVGGGASWRALQRGLLEIDGDLITHTVYQIGSCPVSVFEGPAGWQPVTGGERSRSDLKDLSVLSGGGVSVAAWEYGGRRHVIVAQVPPYDLVQLARQRQTALSRSPGL